MATNAHPEHAEESNIDIKLDHVSDAEALDFFTKGMVRLNTIGRKGKRDYKQAIAVIDLYSISKKLQQNTKKSL